MAFTPLPPPSVQNRLPLRIRQWKQWIWCLFLSPCPAPSCLPSRCDPESHSLGPNGDPPLLCSYAFWFLSLYSDVGFILLLSVSLPGLACLFLFLSHPPFWEISCSSCSIISLSEVVLTTTMLLHIRWWTDRQEDRYSIR